jgi:hypothetical protein
MRLPMFYIDRAGKEFGTSRKAELEKARKLLSKRAHPELEMAH